MCCIKPSNISLANFQNILSMLIGNICKHLEMTDMDGGGGLGKRL